MMTTKAYKTIRAWAGWQAHLRLGRGQWAGLVDQLDHRGCGVREAGAFLLATRDSDGRTVVEIVFYDDLDASCLQGGIHLAGHAYRALWELCDQRQLRVVADVHSHPGSVVRQSVTDRSNPMLARPGHVALIVPDLARRPVSACEVGVHEYLGRAGWRSAFGRDAARLLYIGRWP